MKKMIANTAQQFAKMYTKRELLTLYILADTQMKKDIFSAAIGKSYPYMV